MIRMIQSSSASHAKAYFSDALLKSDYYLDDQELNGAFQGRLAGRLGIAGLANKETFFALCENRHPKTGDALTPRTREERRTGYDINFHCPKSVSIVHVLSKDSHIMEAFQSAVAETMTDIEADSKARVRKGGSYADRDTGELLWVDFTHQTARPVDGSRPDPHLHAHCFVFNATWDTQEGRVKAGQFGDIKRDMPFYQAMFQKRLSDKLIGLGYDINPTAKSFEIAGVPQRVIDLLSKRTDEIGRTAKEKGITDAKALSELGAKTRAKKQKGLGMDDLKAQWREQIHALGPAEDGRDDGSRAIRHGKGRDKDESAALLTAENCLDYAVSHGFERASVVHDRRLLAAAYQRSIGNDSVSIAGVTEWLQSDPRLIRVQEGSRLMCTTREALREEKRMVELARAGQGKLEPLYDEAPDVALSGQQREAVRHLLTTTDRVSIIRGAAGTGKTTLMREAVSWMEKADVPVAVVAPSANASRGVLRGEGFEKAETVALFLSSREQQEAIKNGVLWVDEAGLLGTKDMSDLLEIATRQNARIVLGGDTRQHASVVRGDALRILNTVGEIKSAEVSKIYRQKHEAYRNAVEALSRGDVKGGFERLDNMGGIKAVDPLKPNDTLVDDYIAAVKNGRSGLVISPTLQQGREVTDEIRKRLRDEGLLGKKEIQADTLRNLNLTAAQKGDWRNFRQEQIVQFNQNLPGIRRGSRWTVVSAGEKEIMLAGDDKTVMLPKGKSASFDLFGKEAIAVAKGDKIRITRNGFDEEGKRLNNGQVLEVERVSKDGRISLRNPVSKQHYALKNDYGHIDHAHCITSYASQGRTVDEVFISQPAATFPATDAKQFYVSVSRGREKVTVYTDDKAALLEHASAMGDRKSALELVGGKKRHLEHVHQMQRDQELTPAAVRQPDKAAPERNFTPDIERDYEPGF